MSWQLPTGWEVRRNSTWFQRKLASRVTVYTCSKRGLVVQKLGDRWALIHNMHDTSQRFRTAKDGIIYAEMRTNLQ